MSKKVIGILGGMGPLATADLFQKITLHTVAACDQAHPRVCIDSNTDIADRTAALLHGGEDPVPEYGAFFWEKWFLDLRGWLCRRRSENKESIKKKEKNKE